MITFPDDFQYIGVNTAPRQQFELDRITRHWKTNGATEEQVLAAEGLPAPGDPHPLFPKMFVVSINASESGTAACALDVSYIGCIRTNEDGTPILPAQQHKYSSAYQSATGQRIVYFSQGFSVGVAQVQDTVEFNAPTSQLTWWSYGATGTRGTAPDPIGALRVIRLTESNNGGNISLSPSSLGVDGIIASVFETSIDNPDPTSDEIVAGKFWRNTEVKTKTYVPLLISAQVFGDTKVVGLVLPGSGYVVGDGLTLIGGGGSATLSVTSVGPEGEITGFTISSDDIDSPIQISLAALGGSGSGAVFTCFNLS